MTLAEKKSKIRSFHCRKDAELQDPMRPLPGIPR